jgi:ferredoxin-NADP reductase
MSFVLEATNPDTAAESLVLGAHAKIKLPNRLVRSYSVVSGNSNSFELGIALEQNSRGASKYLHENAEVGTVLQVGRITTDVKVANMASNHVFIAGGIGITAFLAMMQGYHKIHFNYSLHYAVRDEDDVPFKSRVEGLGEHVTLYPKSAGKRMDIRSIVAGLSWNSQLYVCGPARMMEAAREAVKEHGLDEKEVHFEAFEADKSGDPFEVEVQNRGKKALKVGEDGTLLEVLRREFGDDVPSSCEVGNCGTCKVALKCGEVDHRGSALTAEEKKTEMLSCVSRGIGRIVIEI